MRAVGVDSVSFAALRAVQLVALVGLLRSNLRASAAVCYWP